MIERDFIAQKTKEFYIKKYVEQKLRHVGISQIRLKKIPLGEKIIINTSRPSLVVGSKGANIKSLTKTLKKRFKLENPQIEINEVKDIFLDANIVAEQIAGSLERFGSARFKGAGHKTMDNVMKAGAMGVEIIISGKIPGARAKNWRFYMGYLKKCGDVAVSGVRKAKKSALLKSGIIGIKVSIMPPDLILPDTIKILDEPIQIVEEIKEEKKKSKKSITKKKTTKKTTKKKTTKKSPEKNEKVKTDVKTEKPESTPEAAEELKVEEKVVEKPEVKAEVPVEKNVEEVVETPAEEPIEKTIEQNEDN